MQKKFANDLNAKSHPRLAGRYRSAMAGGMSAGGRHSAPGRAGEGVSRGGGCGGRATGNEPSDGLPVGGELSTLSADQLACAARWTREWRRLWRRRLKRFTCGPSVRGSLICGVPCARNACRWGSNRPLITRCRPGCNSAMRGWSCSAGRGDLAWRYAPMCGMKGRHCSAA
jgi:hypothetical protein